MPEDDWGESDAKDYLYSLLHDKTIPEALKPKQVYEQFCQGRPEFTHFPRDKNWPSRLKRLREKAEKKSGRAALDAACLEHDRKIFPKPTVDTKGNAMWQKSKAQELLRKDITDEKDHQMKPKELYESREEYYENYDQDFFRARIYQERKYFKRQDWLKEKAAKKEATKKRNR